MIRRLARRWANQHLADENRRLRHDVQHLVRHGKGLRHALTASQKHSALLSARIGELQHEKEKP